MTLKYDAESEQGLLGILTSVAEKLPANKVIHATMNVVGNIDENQVKEEMKSKGVNCKSLSILDTFLRAKTLFDVSSLLEQSEVGRIGLEE